MAKFGFLKIGEANSEIERLTKALTEANEKIAVFEADALTLTEAAEQARKDAEDATKAAADAPKIKKELDDEKASHVETKNKLTQAEKEVAALPEKIKTEGSKEAQRVLASLGHSPLKTEVSDTPAADKNQSNLTGLRKVEAAFAAQLKGQK